MTEHTERAATVGAGAPDRLRPLADERWVLVTDGGIGQSRSALAAVRALAAGGYLPAVTVSGRGSVAAASRDCRRRVPVPGLPGDAYAAGVMAELAARPYLTAMPTSDAALLALGLPVAHLVDKVELGRRAAAAGLQTPPSTRFDSAAELAGRAGDLPYPVVIKPLVSNAPTRRVAAAAELDLAALPQGPVVVQPYLDDPLHAVAGIVWQGRLVASVHQRYERIWPPDCGGACAAVTTPADRGLEEGLMELLAGYEGMFMAQFAGPYLIDLNPRPYGSLPLAVRAGVNLPAMWCDLLRGRPAQPVVARPGVFYRWLEGDLRHLGRGLRRGTVRPAAAFSAIRPRPGAAHSTESLRDPGPLLARLRFAASRALSSRRVRSLSPRAGSPRPPGDGGRAPGPPG